MASSGNSESGKGHYIEYDGKHLSYRVWHDKNKAMTARRMDGRWEAMEKDCKDLVEKEETSESLSEGNMDMEGLFETSVFFITTEFHDQIAKFHEVRQVQNRCIDKDGPHSNVIT